MQILVDNIFGSWENLSDLLALRNACVTRMIDGKNRIIQTVQSGEVTTEKVWEVDPRIFWTDLNKAIAAKAPQTYTVPTRRTSIRYV